MKYNSIVIAGPTASGKTSLAVEVAYLCNGEILSADSRQVYRGMDIGTGKDLDEYEINGSSIPYHLIDIADPSEKYTLYHYQHDFYKAFDSVIESGHVPVVCGGTGLYIESVLKDYSISSVPEDEEFRNVMMKKSREELLQELKHYPDVYRRTDTSSKKRIVRALEIARDADSDKSTVYQKKYIPRPLVCVLMLDPEILKKRISHRLHHRLKNGMVDEVAGLLGSGTSVDRMMMFGMEYRLITQYIIGDMNYSDMVCKLETEIFRLAKRQRTWFRGMVRRGFQTLVLAAPDVSRIMAEYSANT